MCFEKFRNIHTFFTEHLRTTASVSCNLSWNFNKFRSISTRQLNRNSANSFAFHITGNNSLQIAVILYYLPKATRISLSR